MTAAVSFADTSGDIRTEAVASESLWCLLFSSKRWALATPCWGGSNGLLSALSKSEPHQTPATLESSTSAKPFNIKELFVSRRIQFYILFTLSVLWDENVQQIVKIYGDHIHAYLTQLRIIARIMHIVYCISFKGWKRSPRGAWWFAPIW